jgi:glycosyltransferase involved in cell wall biosynthesis
MTVIPSGGELPDDSTATPEEPQPLIVCVGRIESYKGHQRVIEALPLVRQERPEMRVRIVGGGPFEPTLRRLIASLHVEDAVDIAPIPVERRADLAGVLRRASVVVLLSEYESQGLAAHEALALGRPLLVSDAGALGELRGRPNVRLVARGAPPSEVARAILELADTDPQPPLPLPTWAECVAGILGVYESVLAPGG